jgi:hypothetical protein
MNDLIDIAWLAGFIEGEGYINCDRHKSLLRVTANQKDREPLDKVCRIVGGNITIAKAGYLRRPNPIFTWQVAGSRAAGVIMTLYSFLSARRKAQALQALNLWKSHRSHHRHWTVCKRGHQFDEKNTYVHPVTGMRRCRICVSVQNQRYLKRVV